MLRLLILTMMTILSTACSQIPLTDTPPPSPIETSEPPKSWIIKGKMGFRSAENNGTVTINWQQNDESYRIQVRAPLGQGSALIYGDKTTATIEQQGKQTLSSKDTNNFINDTLGLPLPMDNILFWVRGIPNPEDPVSGLQHGSSGNINQFEQSNWTIQISRYKLIDQSYLPGKLIATQGDNKFVLIINQWQIL